MNERKIMTEGYKIIIKKQIETIYEYLDLNFDLEDRIEDLTDLITEIKRFIEYVESEKE